MATKTSEIEEWFGVYGTVLKRRFGGTSALLFPTIVLETIFFIIPLLILIRLSLTQSTGQTTTIVGTWTLENYLRILSSELIHGIMVFTFKIAIVTTAITCALALFYAYAVWRASGLMKNFLLIAMVLPLLTTLVVRLFALNVMLSPIGPVNTVLLSLGVIQEPLVLIYNEVGVYFGLVYTNMPYAVLAIYSVLVTIDWDLVEAARDLGASRPRSFVEVVLPESMPGVLVAAVLTFTYCIGAYASPAILGSSRERTFAIEVESLMLKEFNWPGGAALSILILVIVLLSIVVMMRLLARFEGGSIAT
jgi:spermidine/putrescine transport system permease protein